jgi:hypothetical protein
MLTALIVAFRALGAVRCGTPNRRARDSDAASPVGSVQAHGDASPTPSPRSPVVDAAGQRLANVAHRPVRRAPRHGRPVAAAMAPMALDPMLTAGPSRPPAHQPCPSCPRDEDRRESAVGRASAPRRMGQAGGCGLRTDRLQAGAATATAPINDPERCSHGLFSEYRGSSKEPGSVFGAGVPGAFSSRWRRWPFLIDRGARTVAAPLRANRQFHEHFGISPCAGQRHATRNTPEISSTWRPR